MSKCAPLTAKVTTCLLLLMWLLGLSKKSEAQQLSTQASQSRRFPGPTIAVEPVDIDAKLLSVVVGTSDGFVLFDRDCSCVIRLNREYREVWRRGRPGRGPGEFSNAGGIAILERGEIAILDIGLARVTVLGRDGSFRRSFPVSSEAMRIVAMPAGRYLLLPGVGIFGQLVDSLGRSESELPLPQAMASFGSFGLDIRAVGGDVVSGAMGSSDILFTVAGETLQLRRGIERLREPKTITFKVRKYTVTRLSPDSDRAAIGVARVGDTLFVAMGGRTNDAQRVIDAYRLPSLTYLSSIRLEEPIIGLASGPGGLVAIREGDFALVALRRSGVVRKR